MNFTIGRGLVLKKFADLWKEIGNQQFTVHRGAVNWPNYDFVKSPKAVAVMMDECSFLQQINTGIVSFEIFSLLSGVVEVDDVALDSLLNCALEVIQKFMAAVDSKGNSYGVVLPESERCVEHYDSSLNVQGLVILFTIRF